MRAKVYLKLENAYGHWAEAFSASHAVRHVIQLQAEHTIRFTVDRLPMAGAPKLFAMLRDASRSRPLTTRR